MLSTNKEYKANGIVLKRKGESERYPYFSILEWDEDGKTVMICLELDLVADGNDSGRTFRKLAEAIIHQIEYSEEHGTQLFRRAPKEYWVKFDEIRINRAKSEVRGKHKTAARDLELVPLG